MSHARIVAMRADRWRTRALRPPAPGVATSSPRVMRQTPKGFSSGEAGLRHRDVALLEDPQREVAAGKEHGLAAETAGGGPSG